MLRGAVDGNVYAAGHAEGGNDLPVLLSSTTAERVEGGYRFNGRKSFGTLTPVWIVKEGPAGLDAFILNIFARCLMGFGNVYYGLARHAFDVTVEAVKNKRSLFLSRPISYHAEVQHAVAEMGISLEGSSRIWTEWRRIGRP